MINQALFHSAQEKKFGCRKGQVSVLDFDGFGRHVLYVPGLPMLSAAYSILQVSLFAEIRTRGPLRMFCVGGMSPHYEELRYRWEVPWYMASGSSLLNFLLSAIRHAFKICVCKARCDDAIHVYLQISLHCLFASFNSGFFKDRVTKFDDLSSPTSSPYIDSEGSSVKLIEITGIWEYLEVCTQLSACNSSGRRKSTSILAWAKILIHLCMYWEGWKSVS